MNIVFWGTPQFAVPSLEALIQSEKINVLAVVTQPDKRRGRGKSLSPSPVKAIAEHHQIPVWQPRRVKKHAETLEKLRACQADAFVVVAYGQLLSAEILEMPRLGCVNAHGSLLPAYRGAAPIQWSLYHNETETGITTMLMDRGMDTGPMLLKSHTPIALEDTAQDLVEVLAQQSAQLLLETLAGLDSGTIQPIAQDDALASYAPLIQKEDYAIDWNRSALEIHNQIRGFYPNCFATFRDGKLKVTRTLPLCLPDLPLSESDRALEVQAANLLQENSTVDPGTIVGILKQHGPIVQAGKGLLLLREVQPSGKRSQSGWDFANGSRLQVGDQLQ